MKKILLTMFAGFFLGTVAMAQESPKAIAKTKKSALKPLVGTPVAKSANDQAKLQAKLAKAKEIESGKSTPASKTTSSNSAAAAALVDPRSN